MSPIAELLNSSTQDQLMDLLGGMYSAVLVGDNLTADAQLFLALEKGDLAKAKEVYESVFKPYFESAVNQKEAA